MSTTNTNKGGVISRAHAYQLTAVHFKEALTVWVELLNSRNEAIRLGAANKIIDKVLPDRKQDYDDFEDRLIKIEQLISSKL